MTFFGFSAAVLMALCGPGTLLGATYVPISPPNAVGRITPELHVTPTGQLLTPAGKQIELPGMRPQALALSPNGQLLATAGKSNYLVLINPILGKVVQSVQLSTNRVVLKAEGSDVSDDPALKAETTTTTNRTTNASANASIYQMSFQGICFSPDGRNIYVSTVNGRLLTYPVNAQNRVGTPDKITLPDVRRDGNRREIAAGLAVSKDGTRLYVTANVNGNLLEYDTVSNKLLRTWATGVAPFDVVLAGNKAYVCNLGGRTPVSGDVTAPAGRSTSVRVDPVRNIANEGTVSVIDLTQSNSITTIQVALHPSALAVSPNHKYVVVACTGSDELQVIDTATDRVVEKICARISPDDLFGAQPNAMTFDRSGKKLFVANGTYNAVAVVQFEPEDNASKVAGLIPAGWFPGGVQFDSTRQMLYVANIRGEGALKTFKTGEKTKLSSKDFMGTVGIVRMPSTKELAKMTEVSLLNMRRPKMLEALKPGWPHLAPRPVPARTGEPSVFEHVIYVIKENRSYDQVLGDMKEGNGDPSLCIFGEKYTPNQHKIAREFVLLDNTYCAGVQSADGHQWTDSGIANEYVERQVSSGFPRSYTGAKEENSVDALAWASSGFIWDNAIAHGKTFRNYGEWMITESGWRSKTNRSRFTWSDFYKDYVDGTSLMRVASHAGIKTLRAYSPTNTVGWDLKVPDVVRAAAFIKDLRQFETNGGFPNLTILFLPNDHTGGTKGRHPKPGAQVADNDLAFGHVVEAVSHSSFWTNTCIFAIEDDPQAGWDHVSGYRTTCYVASAYTKRGRTISTQYNQLSLLRTMELILGLPPMNQLDASATPMFDVFMNTPDFTPFDSVPNRVPLNDISPDAKTITNGVLRKDALMSERLNLNEPDKCPEDTLNRILWNAMKGPEVPYPSWAVKNLPDKD